MSSRAYQIDRVGVAALQAVLLQELPEVGDVAGGEAQRVQLGQFGVGRHPGQAGLQPGEGFAQHPHALPLPGVGRVPLRLPRVFALRPRRSALGLGASLHTIQSELLVRVGVVVGGFTRLRPAQRRGRSCVARLVVLSVARGRASGHGCPLSPVATSVDTLQTASYKKKKKSFRKKILHKISIK